MSIFERVLSDDWLPLEFKSGNEIDVTSVMVNKSTLKSIVEQIEQAVLAKLAEQEPVMFARTYNGEIDWDEDCVTEDDDGLLLDGLTHVNDDGDFEVEEGYAAIPLYAHPCVTPVSVKQACDSQNEKYETQAKRSKPDLAKNQPCGCVVCHCENQDQCQGCGATSCGTHNVGEIPNPIYADHIPDAGKMIPEGWQLVPKEPSRDMLKKMFYEIFGMDGIDEEYLAARYRNMLSLFPKYTEVIND